MKLNKPDGKDALIATGREGGVDRVREQFRKMERFSYSCQEFWPESVFVLCICNRHFIL